MNFNLILLGFDSEYNERFADSILSITKFNNIISLPDIRKSINNKFYSKEYLSRSLFYEDLEQKVEYNNIIIPGTSNMESMKELLTYTNVSNKVNNRTFIVGFLSSSYLGYCERYARMKITNLKSKLPDTMISTKMLDQETYTNKRRSFENLHYRHFFRAPSFLFRADDDIITNTLLFTNYCVTNTFQQLLEEE